MIRLKGWFKKSDPAKAAGQNRLALALPVLAGVVAVALVVVLLGQGFGLFSRKPEGTTAGTTPGTTAATTNPGTIASTTTGPTTLETTERQPWQPVPLAAGSDWPTLMGNNQRNSRSILKSNLTSPVVSEPYYFGNYEGYLILKDSTRSTTLDLGNYPENVSLWDVETAYEFKGVYFDINGRSYGTQMQQNYRYLHLYEGQLNLLYVTEDRSNPRLVVEKVTGSAGQTEALWSVQLPYYHERPHIALADMNHDGTKDIIILGWQGLLVYDSATHELIMELDQAEINAGRKRGVLVVKDINGDDFPEIFILSAYPWDVNVIHNDGKRLSKDWVKIYDSKIESAQKITAYTRNPIEDYDADGDFDMVFNLWNETGDGQWHVKVLDAWSGAEVGDLPNAFLQDAADLDGDRKLEMFLSTPSGIDTPEYSDLRIVRLQDGHFDQIFALPDAKWGLNIDGIYVENMAVHLGLYAKAGVKYMILDKTGGQTAFFAYVQDQDQTAVNRYTLKGQDLSFGITYPAGTKIELVKMTADGGLLLDVTSRYPQPGPIVMKGGINILAWQKPQNQQIKLPIIASLGSAIANQASNDVVLANGVGQVIRLKYGQGGFTEEWAAAGYGAAFQYNGSIDYGAIADDFNSDGKNEIIVRVNGAKGGGVKCMDAAGNTLWQTEFPSIPSGEISTFRGNIGFFTSANMNGRKALVVTGQRHVQHTGITFGLDGKTGEQLWSLDVIRKYKQGESGAGSYYLSTYDFNQDGVDEVMTGYGNNVWAARVDTGELLFANFMRSFFEPLWIKTNQNGWVSNILPIPLFIRDNVVTLFFSNAGDSMGTAQIHLDWQGDENKALMVWGNKTQAYSNMYNQCLADLAGDGQLSLVQPARNGDGRNVLFAYNPEIGDRMSKDYFVIGGVSPVPIACDINSDNRDEVVMTYGPYVEALSLQGGSFKSLWKLKLPASLSWPVYGDIDGDELGEIVVTSTGGNLYVINDS